MAETNKLDAEEAREKEAADSAVEFAESPSEEEVEIADQQSFSQAVLHGTDWTTETLVGQLERGNIVLNPAFQRRDAWSIPMKSRFIESLVLGLPIPQIVLAETKELGRGKFIVLDGKQRLLALLQYWGLGKGKRNNYALTGLDVLTELKRKRLRDIAEDPDLEEDYNALLNQSIRTVVIRNSPSVEFLHLVFLRLNTGSVRLSPQELRQAMFPGPFTSWIDEAASESPAIKALLKLTEPDYRMRDIELLARFLAFKYHLVEYRGRMTKFLDAAFEKFNAEWDPMADQLKDALTEMEASIDVLTRIFGQREVARKPGARPFNRAVFDFLVFYAQEESVRERMKAEPTAVKDAYVTAFEDSTFREAVERDTAGIPNTVARIAKWGAVLGNAIGASLPTPSIVLDSSGEQRIDFPGR